MSNVYDGARKIGREPSRANTVSGEDKRTGPSKAQGARLVAEVMTKQEAKCRGPDQQDADRLASGNAGGVKFSIGDNVAKKIDQDKAPY